MRPADVATASGLTSRLMRIALMTAWGLGMALVVPARSSPSPVGVVASGLLVGLSCYLVTHPHPALGVPRTTIIVATAPVTALVWLQPFPSLPSTQLWGWQFAGNLMGLLAARGAMLPALGGALGQVAVLAVWVIRAGAVPTVLEVAALAQGVLPVLVGVVWNMLLTRSLRAAEHSDAVAEEAVRQTRAAEAAAERGLALLAEAGARARPVLERLAAGEGGPDVARDARVAEADIRDLIRATRLVVPPLDGACRTARESGVAVLLLDDGDEGALPARVLEEVAALVRSASVAATRSITIRALPSGRRDLLTFLADGVDGAEPVRRRWAASEPPATL